MGLKEPGLRGSLRNVSVGIDAIPDSDIYLQDDWGDNKLQDRDGSGTTTHNGVEGVYRPEYIIDAGEPTAENGRINWDSDDEVKAEINLNFDEKITWEITGWDYDGGTGGGDTSCISLFGEGPNFVDDASNVGIDNGYLVQVIFPSSDALCRVLKISNGDSTPIMDTDVPDSGIIDVTVTRENNGDWELSIDGSTADSVNDDQHTTADFYGFAGDDDAFASVNGINVD